MSRALFALTLACALACTVTGTLAAAPAVAAPAHAPTSIVYVQPLQPAPGPKVLAAVASGLRAFYPVQVRLLPAVPLPKAAFYPARRRWRAEILLDWLERHMPADGMKILGLTSADISTTKGAAQDWGVLGLGSLDGHACVLSSYRARRHVTVAVELARMAKVAVHEVGHTFGLEHCPTPGCLMEDARGKVATTDGEDDLCPACRRQLQAAGVAVPSVVKKPWRPGR
jgi:archaemetzincin